MKNLRLPFDRSTSIQAERLAWAIERYVAGELTAEQIEATHEFEPGYGVQNHLRRFRIFRRPIDAVLSADIASARPSAIVASGEDQAMVRVWLGDPPAHRILAMSLMKLPPPGVTTRLAAPADGPALRELERRCPVVRGNLSVSYDRGDDYFAQQRLMERQFSTVVEHEGRIVGIESDAIHPIRVGGELYQSTYRFHLRVDPDARGLGIWPALNVASGDLLFAERPFPIPHVLVAEDNEQMDAARGQAGSEADWTTPVERISLKCRGLASGPFGRRATLEDATRIAALMTASHGREELALDFTPSWVRDRLSRSPRDYSWDNVLISDHAVAAPGTASGRSRRRSADASPFLAPSPERSPTIGRCRASNRRGRSPVRSAVRVNDGIEGLPGGGVCGDPVVSRKF
jgi:hypothetical protein